MNLFINYKRNINPDQELARHLDRTLSAAGHSVFRDESGIAGGDEWPRLIQNGLETADVIVSLLSNVSLQSEWVLNEIDFARRRGKLIVPILLDELDESLEFQEYIPRFRRVQHLVFAGDFERIGRDLDARLRQGLAQTDAPLMRPTIGYDEGDDSENPGWKEFLAQRPHLQVEGKIRLGLDDSVRLAIRRSVFYQRRLRATPADEPALPADRAAFEAYRQGFYTQVALGEFGVTGFSRLGTVPETQRGEVGGFLGLVLKAEHRRCLREAQQELEQTRELMEALREGGIATSVQVDQVEQRLMDIQGRLTTVEDQWENVADDFKLYFLGLPEDELLEIDDSLLPRQALSDPDLDALRNEAVECLNLIRARGTDQTARLGKLRNELDGAIDRMAGVIALLTGSNPEKARLTRELHRIRDDLIQADGLLTRHRNDPRVLDRWANELLNAASLLQLFVVQVNVADPGIASPGLTLEQAEAIARAQRPDRELIATDAALKRTVRQTLRRLLREARRLHSNLDGACRAVWLGFRQVDNMREILMAPAMPGGFDSGQITQSAHIVTERMAAGIVALHEARVQRATAWLGCFALRLRLLRELGLLALAQDGVWTGNPGIKNHLATMRED